MEEFMNQFKYLFSIGKHIEELKTMHKELLEDYQSIKSKSMKDHLSALSIDRLKEIITYIHKGIYTKDKVMLEHALNELEMRIGHQKLKEFCRAIKCI